MQILIVTRFTKWSWKLFVTQKENNNANFVSIFESQTVSWISAQVPSQHCVGGGRGVGGREQ